MIGWNRVQDLNFARLLGCWSIWDRGRREEGLQMHILLWCSKSFRVKRLWNSLLSIGTNEAGLEMERALDTLKGKETRLVGRWGFRTLDGQSRDGVSTA